MLKLTKIEIDESIKCNKEVKDYLMPNYVYIPFYERYELMIQNHEEVTKDSILLQKDDNYIYSSVSGKVMGLHNMIVNSKNMKTIVVENNYKEKEKIKPVRKDITTIEKKELKKLVKQLRAFTGNLDGETLLISGIDDEPYEQTKSYLIHKHTEEILEGISTLIKILGIHKCFYIILNNDQENVTSLMNQIGTYPEIDLKLVPDLFPIGNKEVLIKEFVNENKIDKGVVFLTVEEVFNIYHILKRNKPVTEKLVTFSGNALNKSKVINAKIGTNIKDIIEEEFKITEKDYKIIINGLLSGYEINTLDAIITQNIHSVFIMKKENIKTNKCINCGLCYSSCPMNCNPKSKTSMEKCIKCGLCEYVCPAKRKLMEEK